MKKKNRILKKWIWLTLVGAGILLVTGCNGMKKTPGAQQILEDLKEEYPSASIGCCNSILIERSQLFEEDKKWLADISISGSDDYSLLSATLSVEYNYYDEQGWMLDVENSEAPEIYAESVVAEMSEEDMVYTVNNFDDSMEFVNGSFDSESEMQNINYKKMVYDTYMFTGVLEGSLQCSYLNTDRGWQVINHFGDEEDTQVSINTQNIPGKYESSDNTITIEEISEDGTQITFMPEEDIKKVSWSHGEPCMYSGVQYHAKLTDMRDINYPSDKFGGGHYLEAKYNIVDANRIDDEDIQLYLIEKEEYEKQISYVGIDTTIYSVLFDPTRYYRID